MPMSLAFNKVTGSVQCTKVNFDPSYNVPLVLFLKNEYVKKPH